MLSPVHKNAKVPDVVIGVPLKDKPSPSILAATDVTVPDPVVGVVQVGDALPAEVNTWPEVPYPVPAVPKDIPPAEVIRIFSLPEKAAPPTALVLNTKPSPAAAIMLFVLSFAKAITGAFVPLSPELLVK